MKKKEKYNYFEEFIKMTEYIEESSNKLKELMNNYNEENLDKSIEEIHKLEHSSDRIVHKMRKFFTFHSYYSFKIVSLQQRIKKR